MNKLWDSTFSIVACDPATGALAVAVATARFAAGNRVPWLEFGVGAAAAQSNTDPRLARRALAWMGGGAAVEEALAATLAADAESATRQLSLIDPQGRACAFTGDLAEDWKGHLLGQNCVAAGNLLVGPETLSAMVGAFESAPGRLGDRALAALAAGQAAGGDRRGKRSATLRVLYGPEDQAQAYAHNIDLRVDGSADPIGDLEAIYLGYKAEFRID